MKVLYYIYLTVSNENWFEKRQLLIAKNRYLDTIQELLKKIISGSGIPERAILHLSECHPKTN